MTLRISILTLLFLSPFLSAGCGGNAPMSAYESQSTYNAACAAYRASGDESVILVDVGNNEVAPLECADYPEVK